MMKPILCGVLVLAGAAACSKGSDAKSVVAEFSRKGDSGDCAGLKDYIVAAQRDTIGSVLEQSCQAESQARKADTTRTPDQVLDAQEQGDRATVRVQSNEGGTAHTSTVVLVKENGAWKIDMQATMQNAASQT
jgi:hypothetical protein